MKKLNVVAAIIKNDDLYLIAQRNRNKHMGFKWEFPGGKVEFNETFKSALKREIKEELDIEIRIIKKIAEENYKDSKINILLHYYLCEYKSGIIALNEHEKIFWAKKNEFISFDFVEGDKNVTEII